MTQLSKSLSDLPSTGYLTNHTTTLIGQGGTGGARDGGRTREDPVRPVVGARVHRSRCRLGMRAERLGRGKVYSGIVKRKRRGIFGALVLLTSKNYEPSSADRLLPSFYPCFCIGTKKYPASVDARRIFFRPFANQPTIVCSSAG